MYVDKRCKNGAIRWVEMTYCFEIFLISYDIEI